MSAQEQRQPAEREEHAAFVEALRRTGSYRTARPPGWVPPPPGWWRTAAFQLRLWRIYLDASRLARREAFDRGEYAFSSWRVLREAVEGAGGNVVLGGLQWLTEQGSPAVVVANHMSALETVMLPAFLVPFGEVAFVVKTSLERYPVFGTILRRLPRIPVTRRHPTADLRQVLEQGRNYLTRGTTVVLFPQATRTREFAPEQFNTLGVKLAARSGVPVVPLALKTDFYRPGRLVREWGTVDPRQTVYFEFGPPVRVTGNGRAAHAAVLEFIGARWRAWHDMGERGGSA